MHIPAHLHALFLLVNRSVNHVDDMTPKVLGMYNIHTHTHEQVAENLAINDCSFDRAPVAVTCVTFASQDQVFFQQEIRKCQSAQTNHNNMYVVDSWSWCNLALNRYCSTLRREAQTPRLRASLPIHAQHTQWMLCKNGNTPCPKNNCWPPLLPKRPHSAPRSVDLDGPVDLECEQPTREEADSACEREDISKRGTATECMENIPVRIKTRRLRSAE
jgi:hypothetical protein